MPGSLKSTVRHAFEVVIAFTPWVISMYVLYWFEYGAIWTTQTAHRGKISLTILAVGMGLSFLVQSRITRRRTRN
jgi:hypothetical protein